MSNSIPVLIAVALVMWSGSAAAQRFDLSEGFVRGEGGWAATAELSARGTTLAVRCVDDRLDAYLDPPFELRGQAWLQVRITLPDRDPVVQTWPVEASMGAAFSPGAGRLARLLMSAGPKSLEVADASGTFQPVRLPAAAGSEAIGRVLETCDVPADDLDSLLPTVDTRVIDTVDQAAIAVVWGLGRVLLNTPEREELATRPLALYRRLNYFYAITLPEACQSRESRFRSMPACVRLRERLAAGGMPVIDDDPIEALLAYRRVGGEVHDEAGRPAGCLEADTGTAPLGEIEPEKIFIDSDDRTVTSGIVRATLRISPEGEVTDVRVILARPAFRFERAFQREVRRIRFSPARQNCQPVASTFMLGYTFYIDRAIFPLTPPTF